METEAVMLTRVATPIGTLTVIAGEAGLHQVLFAGQAAPEGLGRWVEEPEEGSVLAGAVVQIREYFAGSRRRFDLPLALGGTAFQQKVWLELASIPYGCTISYAEQARRIGKVGAARAVGSANGRNPVPIVLPCHRVVGANGALTGFGGGLDTKRALLDHEATLMGLA